MRLAAYLIIGIVILVAGFFWANRPQYVRINAAIAVDFPETGFSHAAFEALLKKYVDAAGYVDYAAWHDDAMSIAALDSYLAAIATYSPDNAQERFTSRNDELAYWMYGYNAYVIKGVLSHWPLDSVMEVRAPIEAVKGLGFFYRMRYTFGGKPLSLLTVENKKIRAAYKDPRIHFVLNCGSESCPVIRPELPTGDALEQLLDAAAIEFVNTRGNVVVDHKTETVYLSSIFKWYDDDFLNWLRLNGRSVERGLINYIEPLADAELSADLENSAGYATKFRDFDWAVNASD
jgi:hypothetical protein